MGRQRVAEVLFGCGHRALFRSAPQPGDWVWCTRCDRGVQVAGRHHEADDPERPGIVVLRRGRRRRTDERRTRATDWASGPAAVVVLLCGHIRYFRPPSPAKGDQITCGCCGRATLVLRPVRRSDRHGGPWTHYDLGVPA